MSNSTVTPRLLVFRYLNMPRATARPRPVSASGSIVREWAELAGRIALRRLDLYDVRAEVGEHLGTERAGQPLEFTDRQIDDPQGLPPA